MFGAPRKPRRLDAGRPAAGNGDREGGLPVGDVCPGTGRSGPDLSVLPIPALADGMRPGDRRRARASPAIASRSATTGRVAGPRRSPRLDHNGTTLLPLRRAPSLVAADAPVSRPGCSDSLTTPAGSNWPSLTRSSSGLATRVPGARPLSADGGSRRPSLVRTTSSNRPEPTVRSAHRSQVRERVDRGPGGLLAPSDGGEPGYRRPDGSAG
jgi:hypothetical protein